MCLYCSAFRYVLGAMAIGAGVCFTVASAITAKRTALDEAYWNTFGYAAATVATVTPLTLTNVLKFVLGKARSIHINRNKRFRCCTGGRNLRYGL